MTSSKRGECLIWRFKYCCWYPLHTCVSGYVRLLSGDWDWIQIGIVYVIGPLMWWVLVFLAVRLSKRKTSKKNTRNTSGCSPCHSSAHPSIWRAYFAAISWPGGSPPFAFRRSVNHWISCCSFTCHNHDLIIRHAVVADSVFILNTRESLTYPQCTGHGFVS